MVMIYTSFQFLPFYSIGLHNFREAVRSFFCLIFAVLLTLEKTNSIVKIKERNNDGMLVLNFSVFKTAAIRHVEC